MVEPPPAFYGLPTIDRTFIYTVPNAWSEIKQTEQNRQNITALWNDSEQRNGFKNSTYKAIIDDTKSFIRPKKKEPVNLVIKSLGVDKKNKDKTKTILGIEYPVQQKEKAMKTKNCKYGGNRSGEKKSKVMRRDSKL